MNMKDAKRRKLTSSAMASIKRITALIEKIDANVRARGAGKAA